MISIIIPVYHQLLLDAWLSARSSPVRDATPSASATAEPFSNSVMRAAMGNPLGTRWGELLREPWGKKLGTFRTSKYAEDHIIGI